MGELRVVGLTGTLGAGKSTVGASFERWGAWRIDADQLARDAVRPGTPEFAAIRREWGEGVLTPEGELDRAALREIVFRDPAARARLERIVHPAVEHLRAERMRDAVRTGARVVVLEVPLLLEKGLDRDVDTVVVVDAAAALRRERVCASRGVSPATFDAMDAAQWPADRKRAGADHVILNDGSLAELEGRAREVWDALRGKSPDRDSRTWLADLHMHTFHSHDCLSSPAEVVRRGRAAGLDLIAVTDHNEIDGAWAAREIDPEFVIIGEEVRTSEGLDLIGLFLSSHIPRGGAFIDVADEIHAQGGVVYLPHPFDARRGGTESFFEGVADRIDVVEGFNARIHDPARNRRAMTWAGERGLPVGAGSDAHLLCEIGRGRVRLPPFTGADGFLEAIRAGIPEGDPSGRWVHLGSTWAKIRRGLTFPLRGRGHS